MREEGRNKIFDKNISASSGQAVANRLKCPTCGAGALRAKAKFCATCGHDLREDYAPLDFLRASYNSNKILRPTSNLSPKRTLEPRKLFAAESNTASATAMAFVIYSLVPYLGVLFCPGALILGGVGLAISYQKPQLGGKQTAAYSILFGSIVLVVQILLWWLLYLIPELRR